MNAYLSVENNMLRFRTDDDSINVLFSTNLKVDKILRIKSFSKGMINAEIKCHLENSFGDELCPEIEQVTYDIQGILELMDIPSKSLKKVSKVKVKNSDDRKNKYYFTGIEKNGYAYIEVTDKDKKYRSIHNISTMKLVVTTMSKNMIAEYAKSLKDYYNSVYREYNSLDSINDSFMD